MQPVKKLLKKTIFYNVFIQVRKKYEATKWAMKGCPVSPPDMIKCNTVKEYAENFKLRVFIETGTYLGQMIDETRSNFDEIISIELDKDLFERAKNKFTDAKNITLLQGDSAELLPKCIKEIKRPILFWLDAHYSAGFTTKGNLSTPITREIKSILEHPLNAEHVILIDDARCFNGEDDYPTIKELKHLVINKNPDFILDIKNDIIRIHRRLPKT
jgi:hypothetical protein